MPQVASVAVSGAAITYDKLYSYRVPSALQGHIFVGSMVLVPFGRGKAAPRTGVVIELEQQDAPDKRLKELYDAAPEEEALSEELLALVKYLREATFCTWFDAVRTVLPRGAQYKPKRAEAGYRLEKQLSRTTETAYALAPDGEAALAGDGEQEAKLSDKQLKVLRFLQGGPQARAALMQSCGVGATVAETLVKKGLLQKTQRDKDAAPPDYYAPPPGAGGTADGTEPAAAAEKNTRKKYVLTEEQRTVADGLCAMLAEKASQPALLYGVTGSGKTPVFIHLIRAALARGEGALVLVPEIGLTHQMVNALQEAFGRQVAVQHSGLSASQRLAQWRAIKRGELPVVVGTRSAVFAPLQNPGLIVIDEEQEHTYQSETAPRYDAIEVARRRALRHGALLVLASATPAVADYYAAEQGRMRLFCLRHRYGNMPLPAVEMVDMGAEWLTGNTGAVSARLAQQMAETIDAGGQVILLLNRRGYHRVAVCRECKKSVKCGSCSVPMVYHKGRGARGARTAERPARTAGHPAHTAEHARSTAEPLPEGEDAGAARPAPDDFLLCHHCGQSLRPVPETCPECGGALRFAGAGTQRLEEELQAALPAARLLRMDMDTTARKGAHARMLAQFAAGQYDVLLGTQMVAKGLDFERVKLVGVIGIDSLLFSQSYRAFEHVFSLVTQVVGRSGRAGAAGNQTPGRALIQTVDPASPVLNLAARQDYEAFYKEELAFRKLALYPPFCALCQVGFASRDEADALAAARAFAGFLTQRAKQTPGLPLRVLGPSPMPVVQLAGSYRYRLTLKCRNDAAFRSLAWAALDDYNKEGWPQKATAWLDFNAE